MNLQDKVCVISQSMYFPWCGLLNQILLADTFIHYNDVQFSRGFFNRVQVKTSNGIKWLTVPLKKHRQKQLIDEVKICYEQDWVTKHRQTLVNSFRDAPFAQDAIDIFDRVTSHEYDSIGELSLASIEQVSKYLNIETDFSNSRDFHAGGESSRRLLGLVKEVEGTAYLTGHGAKNYLDHELFESEGVEVGYMDYQIAQYEQNYGEFTPYVTCLDAIAHLGKGTKSILESKMINWKEFHERTAKI